VPSVPATLQASHWPPQSALQQKPSTQRLVEHWSARLQALPLVRRFSHLPALHQPSTAQSFEVEQVVVHPPPAQRKGAHSKPAAFAAHVPVPLHNSPRATVP